MLLKIFLLSIAVSSSLAQECQAPLVRDLPESSFSATSGKASNVRFTTEEPWCPATSDYTKEYVTIDLGCASSMCQVEGRDEGLLFYSGEYSNDNVTWEKLTSKDETHYDPYLGFEANQKAAITPSVRARFFRFRLSFFAGGFKPCFKVELYGETDTVEPLGCFQEKPKRRSRRAMPVVYHRVEGINTKNPDISAIYEECRRKADEYSKFPIEVFGIKNYKRCVTTASGKEDQYSKYGESSKCAVCGGKGIGTRGTSIFAYKKQL